MKNRSYRLLAITIVIVACLVCGAEGKVETCQDLINDYFTPTELYPIPTQTDLITLNLPTAYTYELNQYPTSYWAFSLYSSNHANNAINWLSVGDVPITSGFQTFTIAGRYEYVFNGTHILEYTNGALTAVEATGGNIPYKFLFANAGTSFIVDDIVIGTSEEKVLVSAPPKEYFISKDFIEPAFYGLYSAPNVIAYSDEMHCRYSNNAGFQTIYLTGPDNIVYNTTVVADHTGIITYDLSEIFFNTTAPYGIWTISSLGSSYSETFVYKGTVLTGTDISWDNTTYTDGETATLSYNISETYWVTDDYRYYRKILAPDLSVIESTELTDRPVLATYDVDIDVDTFPISGTYYCALYAQDRSSGEDILMSYDDAEVTVSWGGANGVDIEGTTYDAVNNTALGSCTVTATQLGVPHPTTSNPTDGSYDISGLDLSFSIGVNATKTGWVGFPTYFTPYAEGTYTVDIPLIPSGGADLGDWNEDDNGWYTDDSSSSDNTDYYNSTTDGTGCGGLIYNEPYWTATSGSNVTLSNATWNATVTTGAGGWWQFNETTNGVCGGSYTLTCSKSSYETVSVPVTCVEDEFCRKDCCLGTDFTLTVLCRDLDSEALITDPDVYVELDNGESAICTDGSAEFSDVDYGVIGITCSAVGYYPGTGSAVVDDDTTSSVYLQGESATSNTGMGVGYAPKTVRFTVQTIWGKPIEDCQVNCTGYETTVGSFAWLYELFGVDCNATPIATANMGGLTDYKGDINFVMFEPVQYNCTFVKAGEINKTLTIYPKDDYYLIIAEDFGNTSWYTGGMDINEAINVSVTKGDDGTNGWINISYVDLSGGTTGGTCFLNQTNRTDPDGPENTISSYTIATNNWSKNFTNLAIDGESYHVHAEPTHSTWDFERSYVVNFPKEKVNPMGLSDTQLAMLASFLILFTGLLFGAISAPHSPLVMSFLGWIFLAIGWLDAILLSATAALTLATVMSVLYLVMVRSKKERYV